MKTIVEQNTSVRPSGYRYFEILNSHLGGDLSKVFNGELIYPRQLEIHLPGDGERPCNFHCYYCQGRILEQPLARYEEKALNLVKELDGRCPFIIYGGAYTEPLLNPYLTDFIKVTKESRANFGLHTNGSLLIERQRNEGLISKICELATSKEDYVSISLDAGTPESHSRAKNLKENWFDTIIEGIRKAVEIRGTSSFPSIRVCYLINRFNAGVGEIDRIVDIMKDIGVDSLRFSIPYDLYGKEFAMVKEYKNIVEITGNEAILPVISPLLSKNSDERPYIFYIAPEFQDVEKMTFRQCIYSYYQITIGADGYVYKCSSAASPTFRVCRLGKVPAEIGEFNEMVLANHNPDFNASTCFKEGARCNRMALEINTEWERLNGKD